MHINKPMDGARDIFCINSLNGTFLALQIKAFGPKNFHAWVKKCHFGNFSEFSSWKKWIKWIFSNSARAISKILFILESYDFLAYLECIRSYAWSRGHSEPDLGSVNKFASRNVSHFYHHVWLISFCNFLIFL